MIKVLHFAGVINRYDFIDTVLTELKRDEFQVEALTVSDAKNRVGTYSSDEQYPSTCLHLPAVRGNWLRCYRALAAKIREFRPDVLHAHHYDEALIASILVRQGLVRHLVIGHHYSDHIYVLTRGIKRRAYLAVEKWCNRMASRVVVPSREVLDLLVSQGESESKVEVIPYGTDPKLSMSVDAERVSRLRSEYGLNGRFVVLTSCRLNPEKGLQHFLQAIPRVIRSVPDLSVVMAGDGTARDELEALARELNINDRVTFLGWRSDVLDWIALADCVVQPSLSESFCQVVVESMILETPIIVTPVGVAPDAIVSGERGGILVPIGSDEKIAEAIIQLAADKDLRRCLGRKGHEFIVSEYSLRATASKHEAIYRSLC